MCDTLVVTGEATLDGVTIFGKNSDREPNEAHHVISVPAADHPVGSNVECTHMAIPQVAHTHAVLLAKPYWIWGAEMGANEHGVAIGNEAVFTRMPYETGPGLIGMDLLRLGLERATTAPDALAVITSLLAEYGQGGSCSATRARYYHNSFMIADPHEAWVLETAGRQWAARRVNGVYTISNLLTIGRDYDLSSPNLVSYAVQKSWCKGKDDFHFARCYADRSQTSRSGGPCRREVTMGALAAQQGKNSVSSIIAALRSHGGAGWRPERGWREATVCMHASFGPWRGGQTTGSLVCHLHPQRPTLFVTATAAPCTSIFKPVWLDVPLPDTGPASSSTYDPSSLFWRHELLHRASLCDYATRLSAYSEERDMVEQTLVAAALTSAGNAADARAALSARAFADAAAAEQRWLEQVQAMPNSRRRGWLYKRAWAQLDGAAQMPG